MDQKNASRTTTAVTLQQLPTLIRAISANR
jgi:hypothetical protein